jgi:hypothetical protein
VVDRGRVGTHVQERKEWEDDVGTHLIVAELLRMQRRAYKASLDTQDVKYLSREADRV